MHLDHVKVFIGSTSCFTIDLACHVWSSLDYHFVRPTGTEAAGQANPADVSKLVNNIPNVCCFLPVLGTSYIAVSNIKEVRWHGSFCVLVLFRNVYNGLCVLAGLNRFQIRKAKVVETARPLTA